MILSASSRGKDIITKKIHNTTNSISVEFNPAQMVRLFAVSFKLIDKEKANTKKDMLHIDGTVKKLSAGAVQDVEVSVELFDERAKLLAQEKGEVFPKVLSPGYNEKGMFHIQTDYNSSISVCKLEVTWKEK